MCGRRWLILAAALGGLAVVAGAWAGHGLGEYCEHRFADAPPRALAGMTVPAAWYAWQVFKTGARYHMYHALALLAVGLLAKQRPCRSLTVAGWCFVFGIVFFSGSLYLLTLTGIRQWGAITPIGGSLFIVGWLALGISQWSCQETPVTDTTATASAGDPL